MEIFPAAGEPDRGNVALRDHRRSDRAMVVDAPPEDATAGEVRHRARNMCAIGRGGYFGTADEGASREPPRSRRQPTFIARGLADQFEADIGLAVEPAGAAATPTIEGIRP